MQKLFEKVCLHVQLSTAFLSLLTYAGIENALEQGILKGEVSLYCRPPVLTGLD